MDGRFTTDAIRILPMQPHHIETLARLETLCFSVPWSARGLAAELLNPLAVFFVAEQQKQVLGYCGMHQIHNEASITNVAVFPAHRRKGVGRYLVFEVVRYGIEHGIHTITLEVRQSNAPAIALYESFDFKAIGKRPNFYTLPAEDAIIMRRQVIPN